MFFLGLDDVSECTTVWLLFKFYQGFGVFHATNIKILRYGRFFITFYIKTFAAILTQIKPFMTVDFVALHTFLNGFVGVFIVVNTFEI